VVCVDNKHAQTFFGAMGVIADMLDSFPATPSVHSEFSEEQTFAALVNLIVSHPGNYALFSVLGGLEKVATFLVTKEDVSHESALSVICAILCLNTCVTHGGESVKARLRAFHGLRERLAGFVAASPDEVGDDLPSRSELLLKKLREPEEVSVTAKSE
jgi:hypothetical protein